MVVIAPLEKRYLHDLLPLTGENQPCAAPRFDPGSHPYMDVVNELAGQLGFEFQGLFARATKGMTSYRAALAASS